MGIFRSYVSLLQDMQTCEHVDISSSSNMGRQINPNDISHVFTSTLSQLFGCMLSVTRVTEMTLAPTRAGQRTQLTNQNHRLQVSGHQNIVLMSGNYPLSTCLWSLRINHVDWLFPYCSIPLIVFPLDFFGCLFYVYDCLWLSSPFLLLRPLKTTCNKQKTQQWFLTMMWLSPSRT